MKVLIDNTGIIRGVNVEMSDTGKEGVGIVETANIKGLFDDELQEEIIEEGILYQDRVVCEQGGIGLLSFGDAAVSAEEIGRIIIDVLESRGQRAAEYDLQFETENDFHSFQELSWKQLEEGWKANQYYDCYYIDSETDTDECIFLYYIYPDYDGMETETASALTFRCSVNESSGRLTYTDLRIYSMTKKEYQAAREWLGKKSAIIKDGEIVGGGSIRKIAVPKEALIPDFISNITVKKQDMQEEKDSGKEDRVYIDKSIDVYSLGKTMIENMDTELAGEFDAAAELYEVIKDGWEVRAEYDVYYMAHNEKAGMQLYRYYFYWNKPGEEKEKVQITDVWISQDGVEEMQQHWLMGRSHISAREDGKTNTQDTVLENTIPDEFLTFDWSADNVLFSDHIIQPQDSAQGWQFFLADIDFDRTLEMLIAYTAKHCGDNSLYVYRQAEGKVTPYIDMIATPKDCMIKGINYNAISPYMDIGLLDAYVNACNECRYLSLDCSSFGRDMRGGAYTVVLYETVLEEALAPKEIARITICGTEEEKQYFFLGENVYEAGRLRDMLEEYMHGYEKAELDYIALEKAFSRDIAGLSEEERKQDLEELYEELDKETLKEQAVLEYQQFMDGRRSIRGDNIYSLAMPTGEPDSRYHTEYAIIDSNGDDIPELNIKTAREITIISFENGELAVFQYMMPGSLYRAYLLKNGAYIYYSDRWTRCLYYYFELDESGNKINEIRFYWDENNENYNPDENDDFFFDDNACTMEEWHDRTREYLYMDENGREQIRNQVEWTLYCETDPFETNDQVLYKDTKDGYQLTLYDKEHNEILSESYPESMWINGVSEDVLEIGISVGNPGNYTYYFNKETAEISDTFFDAILIGEKYIAYMEDDTADKEERTLILSDIFKEGILYQEITRDFSKTAEPMSAIISIEMIDSENIRLEYYKGEAFTIESEIVGIIG